MFLAIKLLYLLVSIVELVVQAGLVLEYHRILDLVLLLLSQQLLVHLLNELLEHLDLFRVFHLLILALDVDLIELFLKLSLL